MSAAVESSELATRIVERSTDIDDMTVFRDEIMSMDQFPTLSELLVGLDTCSRDESSKIKSTISQIYDITKQNNIDCTRFMQLAILIAFKRRNHDKSQAKGTGSGEKLLFLQTLTAILELHDFNDLVISVLPLLPTYGCWKDLSQLATLITTDMGSKSKKKAIDIDRDIKVEMTSDVIASSTASALAVKESTELSLHPVAKLICELFAIQLDIDRNSDSSTTPSNACKYVPHSGRSKGETTVKKRQREEEKAATTVSGRGGRGAGRGVRGGRGRRGLTGRGGRGGRGATTRKIESDDDHTAKRSRSEIHQVNKLLAEEIEKRLCPDAYLAARGDEAFRKIRASLNKRLVNKGHLLEPLICNNQFQKINFFRANKGTLTKITQAIKRRPEIMNKWKKAMLKSGGAVNDLDSLFEAALAYIDELKEYEESSDPATFVKIFPLRLKKAIESTKASRDELLETAGSLTASATIKSITSASAPSFVTPTGIFIDTSSCSNKSDAIALLLAGYIAAKSMNLKMVVVNGEAQNLVTADGEVSWDAFCQVNSSVDTPVNISAIQALSNGIEAILASYADTMDTVDFETTRDVDIVLFCRRVEPYNDAQDEFISTITRFQEISSGAKLRTLRLHRVTSSAIKSTAGEITFTPRINRLEAAVNPKDVSADILFIVDFTGSMGSYMAAVKKELVSIIVSLQDSTGIQKVRVGLIGYRDYGDTDRIVSCDFCDQDNLGALLDMIRNQQASGGGDAPEDLLSAMVAARALTWTSMFRLSVIITDADAHGMNTVGDYHKSGRCPDQEGPDYPDMLTATSRLAKDLTVDMFFCRVHPRPLETEVALAKVYNDTGGFGVISLLPGTLKDQIILGLGHALVTGMTKSDKEGLQTIDGCTVSSLKVSLEASIRETISAYSEISAAEAESTVAEDASIAAVEETAAKAIIESEAKVEVESPMRDDAEEFTTVSTPTISKVGKAKAPKKAAETDFQRLCRELRSQDLRPVRVALQLHLSTLSTETIGFENDTMIEGLAEKSVLRLLEGGITASDLYEHGYPSNIIALLQKTVRESLKTI